MCRNSVLVIKQLPVRQFSYNLCKRGYINNRCFYFATNNKIANFAAFFVDRGVMIRMVFQKEYKSIRVLLYFFMLNYFGVSNNLLTHTHTHTHSFLNSQKNNAIMGYHAHVCMIPHYVCKGILFFPLVFLFI